MGKIFEHFTKRDIQMSKKDAKRCFIKLVTREMQMKVL